MWAARGACSTGLSEEEFAYILTTFPLVTDAAKIAAHNAFRNVEKGLVK